MSKLMDLPVIAYIRASEDLVIYLYKIEDDRALCRKVGGTSQSTKRWYNLYTTPSLDYNDPFKSLYLHIDGTAYFLCEFKDIRARPKLGRILASITNGGK